MGIKFSTSINITRDENRTVNYIPTENATRVFGQIFRDFETGIHSFTIIGSYGTGKSAFLLAMQRSLAGGENVPFAFPQFEGFDDFQFLSLVGEYNSLIDAFGRQLNLDSDAAPDVVINALEKRYQWCAARSKNLVIFVDEFGKFLEFAAKHDPDRELYFIQQLAEFANHPDRNIILIATLHQGFDAYAHGLRREQRQEWTKVKGRLKEITFNEPVEQLLFLAAEQLGRRSKAQRVPELKQLNSAIEHAHAFPLKTDLNSRDRLSEKLFPLELMSAAAMTLALQRYGQNERSLFTFLESRDHLGLFEFKREGNGYFHLAAAYDFLNYNYFSFLASKYNPDFTHWSAIRKSLERAEVDLAEHYSDAAKLIKTIGLLNLFASAAVRIDPNFLQAYGQIALAIAQVDDLLRLLENKKIIRFIHHKERFILFEGTDVDIEKALLDAEEKVPNVTDVVGSLQRYFSNPVFAAKAAHYELGTPRYFRIRLSETPIEEVPRDEIDGFVNLIFSEILGDEDLRTASQACEEAVLFGRYHETNELRRSLYEIAKIQHVIDHNLDDAVAVRELRALEADHKASINNRMMEVMYGDGKGVSWFFQGRELRIGGRNDFHRVLSTICREVYPDTPMYRMELINRHKLPSALSKARRSLMHAMYHHGRVAELGFPDSKFPPEKTIYLTLLKRTGMHRDNGQGLEFGAPNEDSGVLQLWKHCEAFLASARLSRKNLEEFFLLLGERPLKLKRGFVDFWLPIFLMVKKDDFALYEEEKFIPRITSETIDLILKKPKNFWIKSFNVKGVRLDLFNQIRTMIQLESVPAAGHGSFIETIVPFLTFYKGLPSYTKRTKRLSAHAIAIRTAIEKAKDPEKTFFEDFPAALGFGALNLREAEEFLERYVEHLNGAIRELRECFDKLTERIEKNFLFDLGYDDFDFDAYKEALVDRFGSLQTVKLLKHQKLLYQRLVSPLDDRVSWISSVVQALIGKHLDQIADEEEELIIDRFVHTLRELDNLCEIGALEFDDEKEEVISIELQTPGLEMARQLIRLPRKREAEITALEERIEKSLHGDERVNLVALLNVLKKKLQHD